MKMKIERHNDAIIFRRKKIWIDLDNSPHVPFFNPIIKEIKKCGVEITLTARDCFQVCGLAELFGLQYKRIGRHYGKNKILKVIGTIIRSIQLLPTALRERPSIAVSHGSRSQLIAAKMLGIPVVNIFDYEFTQGLGVIVPDWVIVPKIIPDKVNKSCKGRFLRYPGIKEDVYASFFKPNINILRELGIGRKDILVSIRPPATEAHYHNPESEKLFVAVVEFIAKNPDARIVILPRNEIKQTEWIKKMWAKLCDGGKIIIPDHAVNGLNLIWHSDFVVSGGGTMNREAAALGVPVYSIFRGKIGAVDRYLSENGRLTLLESIEDIKTKLKIVSREKSTNLQKRDKKALDVIVNHLIKILSKI
jgi:predicted glycosyltransferase